jgi:hypothetical protein
MAVAKEDKKDQSTGVFSHLKQMFSRNPSNTGDRRKPNETASNHSRQGWDTPNKTPPAVKADDKKKQANPAEIAKAESNKQRQADKDYAKAHPAIGKAPPPVVAKPATNPPANNNNKPSTTSASSGGNKSNTSSGNKSGNKSNDKKQ